MKHQTFQPHCWVILGHGDGDAGELRETYERELRDRFHGATGQHYVLSMARMFQSVLATYILLEQSCSEKCRDLIAVPPSILVAALAAPLSRLRGEPAPERKTAGDTSPVERPPVEGETRLTYFDKTDRKGQRERTIRENILERRSLWEEFLTKRQMTMADFKRFSNFREHGVAGFRHFLTRNDIARSIGQHMFELNEAVIPRIRELLDQETESL